MKRAIHRTSTTTKLLSADRLAQVRGGTGNDGHGKDHWALVEHGDALKDDPKQARS